MLTNGNDVTNLDRTDQYTTLRQGNTQLLVNARGTGAVDADSLDDYLDITATVAQNGSESGSRSDQGSTISDEDNGFGLTVHSEEATSTSQQGNDSFNLVEDAQAGGAGTWAVDSYTFASGSQQTASSADTKSSNWQNVPSQVNEIGSEASSQSKQDAITYQVTDQGQYAADGSWDDTLSVNETGQETFAYAHSGSKTTTTTTTTVDPALVLLVGVLAATTTTTSTTTLSGAATLSGLDSFTFTQVGDDNDATVTLQRDGNDSYTHGPGSGTDSFTVSQIGTLEEGVLVSSTQGGSSLSSWVWPSVQLPPGPLPLPDVGDGVSLAWDASAGQGVVVPAPTDPLVPILPGEWFAAQLLSSANRSLVQGPSTPPPLGFVLPVVSTGPGAGDVLGATNQLTQGVLGVFAGGISASEQSGANVAQVWTRALEAGLGVLQTAQAQLAGGVFGRFSSDARWQTVDMLPNGLGPTPPPAAPAPWSGDLLRDSSNFFAGWSDTLTFGLTARARGGLGYDDVVDKASAAYALGSTVGQVQNIGLMLFTGGASGLLSVAERGLQVAGMVGGTLTGVEALQAGDIKGAIFAFVSVGLAAARGVSACSQASTLVGMMQRVVHGVQAGRLVVSSMGKFADGDWVGGFVDLADAGANLYMMGCFAAGTPLLTPTGHQAIEAFQVGDAILARSENNPDGALEVKQVEEVFVRLASILHLHVGGQVIRTTAEHPFYVRDKGWVAAGELTVGDLLSSHDGQWVAVEDLLDTGEFETVYNLRVADYHTYFVGSREWSFSVWSHNVVCGEKAELAAAEEAGMGTGLRDRGRRLGQEQGREGSKDQLTLLEFDPNTPSNVRGWLSQERRLVEQGRLEDARVPPGYVMAHGRTTPAREGFDGSNTRLQSNDLNMLEEAVRRGQGVP